MKIDLYLHSDKEGNYEAGEKALLNTKALQQFAYACHEVKITLEVDPTTGHSTIVAVNDKAVTA